MRKKISTLIGFVLLLSYSNLGAQTKLEAQQISAQYNLSKLLELQNAFYSSLSWEKSYAIEYAKKHQIPLIKEEGGTYAELQRVLPDGTLIYYTTFNVDAAKSTRTNYLHIGGGLGLNLMGLNMTAHIWDGGLARTTHQEYDGPGGNNRFSIGDGTSALHYHSAHVTGTIIASGVAAQSKGMAPYAKAIGYDWNYDLSEATTAAANGMLISNHSYGYQSINNNGQMVLPTYYPGAYIADSRDWDNLLFNAPYYLMVVAAGNDGQYPITTNPLDGMTGYDKLTGHATAKNNLVVANAQDANINASGNLVSVTINSSSSQGPTDDYRIKPDITGNGTGVYSTYETADNVYASITGTSMASPNVAGSLLLLQEHYRNLNNNFMRAATLKGLALHTADDAGSTGPDAIYGWGLLNAKRAAETISNNESGSLIQELTINNGQTLSFNITSDGFSELKASISWTDRPGTITNQTNSNTPRLVHDLDIRLTKDGTTYYPWKLTGVTTNGKGDNIVDPFERIDIPNASGTYTVTISHKGTLTGGSQNFSLIITGIVSSLCDAAVTSAVGADVCGDEIAQISAIANAQTTQLRLYESAIGGTPIATINGNTGSFTTPLITQTKTFYVVAATNSCESSRFPVTINHLNAPSPLLITRVDNGANCDFNYAELTASGGIENFIPYSEDFSAGNNISWAYSGNNNNPNNPYITLYISNANTASGNAPEIALGYYSGNNVTGNWQFFPYNRTTNQLIPVNISGLSTLEISFKYMFDAYTTGNYAKNIYLEISTNGTTYTPVWSRTNINADIQATTVTVDLSSYLTYNEIYFRFRYGGDSYGLDYWYVDDVILSGQKQNQITWSPIEGLFTDANLTIPYTGGHAFKVYAQPNDVEQYTATVGSSANSCQLSQSETVQNIASRFFANSGNWDVANNWKPNVVPDIDRCVRIPAGKLVTVNIPNAEAKNVQIDNNGKLVISTGNSLTVADEIVNLSTENDFVLESDANLIQLNESAVNVGNLKAQRFITTIHNTTGSNGQMDYIYWSSPVQGQSLTAFSPGTPTNRIYQYNEATDYFNAVNLTNEPNFLIGKGYAFRAEGESYVPFGTDKTYEFKGVPNNGTYSTNILKTNSNTQGFNLVGNPYPSNIDADELFAENPEIFATVLFWENTGHYTYAQQGSNYAGNNYAIYNRTGGNPATTYGNAFDVPNGIIKVGQGFIVQKRNVGTTPLVFKNSMRLNTPGIFYQKAETDRFWLRLNSPSGSSNATLIGYVPGATDGFDWDYDATYLECSNGIYSINQSEKLSIQGLEFPVNIQDVIPIGVSIAEPGVFTFDIPRKEGIFQNQTIYLKDKKAGVLHNLSQDGYRVMLQDGEYVNRFEILFVSGKTKSKISTTQNHVYITKTAQNIEIESEFDKIQSVEVFDLNGKSIYQKNSANSLKHLIPRNKFPHQILFVTVQTELGDKISKKIIND